MKPLTFGTTPGPYNQNTLEFLVVCQFFALTWQPSEAQALEDIEPANKIVDKGLVLQAVASLVRYHYGLGLKTPQTLSALLSQAPGNETRIWFYKYWLKARLARPEVAAAYLTYLLEQFALLNAGEHANAADTFRDWIAECLADFEKREKFFSKFTRDLNTLDLLTTAAVLLFSSWWHERKRRKDS